MDKFEAGAFIKAKREGMQPRMTQTHLAELVGAPDQTYISSLEKGRVNIATSEYFPAIAKILKLTEDEIRSINPSLIINLGPEQTPSAAEKDWIFYQVDKPIKGDVPLLPEYKAKLAVDPNQSTGLLLYRLGAGDYVILHSDNPLRPPEGLLGKLTLIELL